MNAVWVVGNVPILGIHGVWLGESAPESRD